MERKRKVYICGPMRDNEVATYKHLNFDAFDRAATKLRLAGFVVVSPAELDRLHEGWGQYPPDEYEEGLDVFKRCIRRDVNALLEFEKEDAIYLLKDWEFSSGGNVEFALARSMGLEVIYEGATL